MTSSSIYKIAIIGTRGVPAKYGGFETLAENIVHYHQKNTLPDLITVYCSTQNGIEPSRSYLSARLKYIPLNANGLQSILYDVISLILAMWAQNNTILLLGVSGALILPLIRSVSRARIVTNIDGIEWQRSKWRWPIKYFLKFSERMAVRFSHAVIADNDAISRYVAQNYGVECDVIAYGGDHAISVAAIQVDELNIPVAYAFSVCRIEPENNVHLILDAFARQKDLGLVMVGNWSNSNYGEKLYAKYKKFDHIALYHPIYELGKLKTLRTNTCLYVHGHSAGGTNPSLVEAMHFGRPVAAFDCSFNRATTENKSLFFRDSDELLQIINRRNNPKFGSSGLDLLEVARRRYSWEIIASEYFHLMRN